MNAPWLTPAPLDPERFARLRTRAIFDCCKWDPQVEDVCTIADVPIVLTRESWEELRRSSEQLAAELRHAEDTLVSEPDLHAQLALPRAVTKVLASAPRRSIAACARIARFDFHHTPDGWCISEVNSDVPGGLNEASGLAALMAESYSGAAPAGDPAGAYAEAIARDHSGAQVALVYATCYTDDHQVMTFLARQLAVRDVRPSLVSPAQLRWHGDHAYLDADTPDNRLGAIVRFFPAEWLPNLPAGCTWTALFGNPVTPVSNPAVAVLTQSKRFPLVWDRLPVAMPAWRAMLPETRDPRDVPWDDGAWVLKPVLGRVGEGVCVPEVTPDAEWRRALAAVRRSPTEWVAQRRFSSSSIDVAGRRLYPTVGIYTIDGAVAGAYGRLADRPLINALARDAAVLVADAPLPNRASGAPAHDRTGDAL